MADLLAAVAEYLVEIGLVVDVYKDVMPPDPDNMVTIFEYPGRPPPVFSEVVERNIQIAVRDVDPDQARLTSWSIYKALHQEGKKDLTDTQWGLCYAQDTPFRLKMDENGRTVYACNYSILTQTD